jgi:hypothetical protein
MSKLLSRVRRLESQLQRPAVRAPHSREARDYWVSQVCRSLQGEEGVDEIGLTREMVDEVMAEYHSELKASGRKEVWSDQGSFVPPDRPS